MTRYDRKDIQRVFADRNKLFPLPTFDEVRGKTFDLTHHVQGAMKVAYQFNQKGTGRFKSGLQVKYANEIGYLGEMLYSDLTGLKRLSRAQRSGCQGADFSDGTDVKATARYDNPWLKIPETQVLAPYFCLVAIDIGQAFDDPFGKHPVRGWLVWRVSRAEVLEAAAKWANEADEYRWWYGKEKPPHYCVNWRTFEVRGANGVQGYPEFSEQRRVEGIAGPSTTGDRSSQSRSEARNQPQESPIDSETAIRRMKQTIAKIREDHGERDPE